MAAPSAGVLNSSAPAMYGAAVTPHDSTNFSSACRGLYVGGAGNVAVVFIGDGAAVTFSNVPAGTILPVSAIRVNSTNTTATNIVALW
jgi:hypothetical protein